MDFVQLAEKLTNMLQPRLTTCSECTDISVQLSKIDCKLVKLGSLLYGNVTFLLNNSISAVEIFDLLMYKRILTFRQVNPDYASICTEQDEEEEQQVTTSTTIYPTPDNMSSCCEKIIKYGISSDVSFEDIIPAKYVIATITIDNLSNVSFQLIIELSNGTEIFNDYTLASGLLTLTLNIPVIGVTGINISSPDWSDAEINLSITVQEPF